MTFKELFSQIKHATYEWDTRVKELNYRKIKEPIMEPYYYPEHEQRAMHYMVKFLDAYLYNELKYDFLEQNFNWRLKLYYKIDKEEKLSLVKERIKELGLFLEKNFLWHLNALTYFKCLQNEDLAIKVYRELPYDSKLRILEIIDKNCDLDDIFETIESEMKSFLEIHFSIMELRLLKVLAEEITTKVKTVSKPESINNTSQTENEYREIFKSSFAFHLFNHIILDQQAKGVRLGPAFLTKLFHYFRKEKLIFKKIKSKPYLRFLETRHNLRIKRLDDRVYPDTLDFHIFDEIKKVFKDETNISN